MKVGSDEQPLLTIAGEPEEVKHQNTPSVADVLFSIAGWMGCSVSMNVCNKISIKELPLPWSLVLVQLIGSAIVAVGASAYNGHLSSIDVAAMRRFAPIPIFFVLTLWTSFQALEHNSLGATVLIHNCSPLVSLALEFLLRRQTSSDKFTAVSFVLILIGTAIFAEFDVHVTARGAALIVAQMVLVVISSNILKYLMVTGNNLGHDDIIMLYNNGLGSLLVLLAIALSGEWRSWSHPWAEHSGCSVGVMSPSSFTNSTSVSCPSSSWRLLPIAASIVAGAGISYAGIRLQRRVSATTFMVVVCFDKMNVLMFALLFFKETYSALSVTGGLISIIGSLIYSAGRARSQPKSQGE